MNILCNLNVDICCHVAPYFSGFDCERKFYRKYYYKILNKKIQQQATTTNPSVFRHVAFHVTAFCFSLRRKCAQRLFKVLM